MKLLIKNMVCSRCVRVVREDIEKIGIKVAKTDLGYVELVETVTQIQLKAIEITLNNSGFELITDERLAIIEEIKLLIINEIHSDFSLKVSSENFSDFLVKKLNYDYSYLSSSFSTFEKTTIEKYIISQKIERTKELLFNGNLNLSEIAWKLGYSSVAHLSNQFKQIVGITPTEFKNSKLKKRNSIDTLQNHVNLV
ncbi:helix-turn-helix transcriptional regulator [Emticicia sp. W12TSBA100-4]|uniref:helix-turn-helix transcriptional regulator n=1 Tax=Emticicia sp. W12TSBA100-4 TaxID=3160965 RepID=UPI00330598A9